MQAEDILKMSHTLTDGERRVLVLLAEDHELTYANPGGWWIDSERISAKVCMSLLRKCLITHVYGDIGKYEVYKINEWGKKRLAGERPRR